jgi:hypothetical protein
MIDLETHYRRLLAFFPRQHRESYEDEMVGVLLADAGPGQRRPGVRDVLDLAVAAGALHWRHGVGPLRDEAWRRAAQTVQLFGAILLLAVALRRITLWIGSDLRYPGSLATFAVSREELLRPALWLAVLIAVLIRFRPLVVVLALAGSVAEIAAPAARYVDTPATVLTVWWIVLAALAVVVASLVARPGGVPGGWQWVAGAGVVIVGGPLTEAWRTAPVLQLGGRAMSVLAVLALGAAVLLAAVGATRGGPAVGRRVAAYAAAVAVALPLVQVGFGPFIEHNQRIPRAELLSPAQWAALVAIPVATFLLVAAATRRYERTRR